MSESNAMRRKKHYLPQRKMIRKYGFYASTFTPEERRFLESQPDQRPEFALLRTKILRLARLTPLTEINEDQLDTLIKLVRVVAALDAMERTGVMRMKAEGASDPTLDALAALEGEDP